MTQAQAISILKTGASVFLTGEPGAGKTHTVNAYVAYLRQCGVEPAITASTGIAATHIGGMTIHSWSGVGIRQSLDDRDLEHIVRTEYITKRIKKAHVLIIDEVSMLTPNMVSMVDSVCRNVRQDPKLFGGLQVIFVGDFFQLPPIMKMNFGDSSQSMFFDEVVPRFAYDASAWTRADLTVCYLTEQHRQDDSDFLRLLSAIRSNVFGEQHRQLLDRRLVEYPSVPATVPKLFTHNADVDRINNETLAKLPGDVHSFPMSWQGTDALVGGLIKGCLSPETLNLKVGASVMFTKNNPKENYVNGTLGTVKSFDSESGFPIVTTQSGRQITVESMDWVLEENGKTKACITQFPLRLAWAITVHKSQGMSLDSAAMDLKNVFEFGQGYVALSRVRRLDGLYLLGWNTKAFQVDPDIVSQDLKFRMASDNAEAVITKMSADETRELQEAFIKACGGKIPSEYSSAKLNQKPTSKKSKTSSSEDGGSESSDEKTPYQIRLDKIREKHPNAYQPWNPELDQELRELFTRGSEVRELVTKFGRQRNAIRARLLKLGLIKDEREPN